MFERKWKALTFSYDDGVLQDKRLLDIFNKYNLKRTFNLNSELLGKEGNLILEGKWVNHTKVAPCDVRMLYEGHEVAVHTLTHPNLCKFAEEDIVREVEQDRLNLSKLIEEEVYGMAYPLGRVNDYVAGIVEQRTEMKYARTIKSTYSFDVQDNLYQFNPTVYHMEWDKMFALGEEFLELKVEKPQIYYIWGHSYEFDLHNTWDKFEEFCRMMSGRDDIFYGTNRQVLLTK